METVVERASYLKQSIVSFEIALFVEVYRMPTKVTAHREVVVERVQRIESEILPYRTG